ncbi:hypothetical protein LPJ66_009508, partial [Kickxella alabastrina]
MQTASVFHHLFAGLQKPHSQIRLSSLQAIDHLFQRSHAFRQLLISRLPEFLALALGAYKRALPEPAAHARMVMRLGRECVYRWVRQFGIGYQRLVYAYRFLRYIEGVDFREAARAVRARDPERVRRRRQLLEENRQEYMRRSFAAVCADMNRWRGEIKWSVRAVDQCFGILVPDIAGMFDFAADSGSAAAAAAAGSADEMDECDDDEVLAVMAANRHAIHVEVDPDNLLETEEGPENTAVFDVVRDHLRDCVQRHRVRVALWVEKLARVDAQVDERVGLLRAEAVGLQARIGDAVAKCRELGVDFAYMD